MTVAEQFHNCPEAVVAAVTEPTKGEFYIMLGEGDHGCTRWRLSVPLLKKLRREINKAID
jgi:hypothetical protein